jgi:hypothetical protein
MLCYHVCRIFLFIHSTAADVALFTTYTRVSVHNAGMDAAKFFFALDDQAVDTASSLDVDVPIDIFEPSIPAQNVHPLEYVPPDLAAAVVGALVVVFSDDGL